MDIVDIVSEITGLSSQVSESITVVILIGLLFLSWRIILFIARTLFFVSKADSEQDTKELEFRQRLLELSANQYEDNKCLREAYQKNLLVIEEHTEVLKGMKTLLTNFNENMEVLGTHVETATIKLEDIKNSLFKTSKTTVVIKDSLDGVMLEFTVAPEDGKLVVRPTA